MNTPSEWQRTKAALLLQRNVRIVQCRALGKSMLSLWPSLSDLKQNYLSPVALAAGAADCEWYTDEMIVTREALRSNPDVVAALHTLWNALILDGAAGLSKAGYWTLGRKMYLVLKAQSEEADFDPDDCLEGIEADWDDDAGGKDHLSREDFERCFFELTDLYTTEVLDVRCTRVMARQMMAHRMMAHRMMSCPARLQPASHRRL